jgi:hypothetical protein
MNGDSSEASICKQACAFKCNDATAGWHHFKAEGCLYAHVNVVPCDHLGLYAGTPKCGKGGGCIRFEGISKGDDGEQRSIQKALLAIVFLPI